MGGNELHDSGTQSAVHLVRSQRGLPAPDGAWTGRGRMPSGNSAALRALVRGMHQVARHDSKVLITGETGTGKEIVALGIHDLSARRLAPFVPVNCGAIPAELLESELFGHEKGAFSGAISTRKGRFEMAEGGTLFLDEIGEMPLAMQVKLLRVLQDGTYERVGGNVSRHCDVRVVAATHRDLEARIAGGSFREDLYHRLNVCALHVPPLRQRLDDLPALIAEFTAANVAAGRPRVRMSERAQQALVRHAWPGNVRELENLLERLSVMCDDRIADVEDLPPALHPAIGCARSPSVGAGDPQGRIELRQHMAAIERGCIERALDRSNNVIAQAAQLLGIKRTTLMDKLRRHKLSCAGRLPTGTQLSALETSGIRSQRNAPGMPPWNLA